MGTGEDTKIITAGRHPEDHHGAVNPPVYHASTILFPTVAAFRDAKLPYRYGRRGTPTSAALQEAISEIEGGAHTVLTASGLSAVATALFSYLKAGDHLLMVDSCYDPIRYFCDNVLSRFGVQVTYYDPLIGAGIAGLMRAETRVVFTESPGSLTFEVQDLPAIADAAHAKDALVLMDNTWASPLFFKPLAHGADVSIQSATKYIVGHADAMLGAITTTDAAWERLRKTHGAMGQCAGPDDIYLAQRGLRTLKVRLDRHMETGLALADWLAARPEVARILHPGRADDPGHALWQRDFTGASGLFGVVLNPVSEEALTAMLDGMNIFGMGFSWGGYESLMIPIAPEHHRTATKWQAEGPCLRIHAGLEGADDLIADLDAGLARLNAAAK